MEQQDPQLTKAKKKKNKKKTLADTTKFDRITMKPIFPPPREGEGAEGHQFWKDQPVPHYADKPPVQNRGYLNETLEGVRTTPFDLPPGYVWATFDFNIESDLTMVYEFLRKYYSNNFGTFQFNYSPEMLKWCMCPPGYSQSLHIGIYEAGTDSVSTDSVSTDSVNTNKNRTLIGFISGEP